MNYDVTQFTDRLTVVNWFPTKRQAVLAVGELLLELCPDEPDAEKLVSVLIRRFDQWPGPATLQKLHAEVILAGRSKSTLPEGCDLCREVGGYRYVFVTSERLPNGETKKTKVLHDPTKGHSTAQGREHRAAAKAKGHEFSEVLRPCTCALGTYQRESLKM